MAGKRAVVFSGGGAKGGYEIGVWRALREIGFVPDIITGTSVGAFNGALMALDKYEEALELWENMGMDSVFAQFAQSENSNEDKHENYITKLAKEVILKGGADYTPLSNLTRSLIDDEKLRSSSIEYGLVTTTFPYKKPVELFINDIPEGMAADYVMASASPFPVVKTKKIGDSKYVDGGFSNNMPVQMAIDHGAEEIVAVNIGKMAVQKLKENNAVIHYIQNRRPFNDGQFGTMLMFDKELSQQNIQQGYLDACRAFQLLDGYYYSFEKYEKYKVGPYEGICSQKFNRIFCVLPSVNRFEAKGRQNVINYLRNFEERPFEFNASVLFCAETAAEMFGFNPREIYTLQGLSQRIVEEANVLLTEDSANSIAAITRQLDSGISFELFKTVMRNWDKKLLLGFCLQLLLEEDLEVSQKRRLWVVSALMPDVFCAALFCCAAILCNDDGEVIKDTILIDRAAVE